jgi:glycosyltransferase involved in cell wall biosynthesis
MQQRYTGWGHPRQGAYAAKVERAIREANCAGLPFVLQNDPELAVYLRQQFPDAFILHLAQNSNTCSDKFRKDFGASVNVAAAVSDYCARWNADYFKTNVSVFYNSVDSDRFTPAAVAPDGPPVINFVGRTDRQKAPDLLLRAAQLLAKRTRNFKLQILGSRFYGWSEPDAYQLELDSLADDLVSSGIEVARPGFINRHALPDELRKAHIHVVPSRWDDPCPLVTLEGMACGLATVASQTGGTPELVGDAGFLFERDSAEQLAEWLYDLVSNPELRADMGKRARERAVKFSWDNAWQGLKGILHLPAAPAAAEPLLAGAAR